MNREDAKNAKKKLCVPQGFEDCIIIENKAVSQLLSIHEAQLLTYLKLRGLRLGFLLNWNVRLMKNGIKRMVNQLEREPEHLTRIQNKKS